MAVASCARHQDDVDALMRSRVDALNKASFTSRYNDAAQCEVKARQALSYINDSLPEYDDGRLRAWNNIATSFFFRTMYDSASTYIDSVLAFNQRTKNREMEQVLAQLLKARLLQRQCNIAECYQILYDIESSGILDGDANNMLISLAKSEFYIATTTLNYHYRNKSQYEQSELMVEMEQQRDKLHCDYSEDLSFNYAIAYGYYALCSDTTHQSDYLAKALHYCEENIKLLSNPTRYSTYHLANTYQLIGFMLRSDKISEECWNENSDELIAICDFITDVFGFELLEKKSSSTLTTLNSQLSMAFHREAAALFFLHNDPYQRIGAVVATGRCCMIVGDTATARDYFIEGLLCIEQRTAGGTPVYQAEIGDHIAPKLEAMLYEGLLVAGCAENQEEVASWTKELMQLHNFIKQNEKADFILQQELSRTHRSSVLRLTLAIALAITVLALLVTLLMLRRRTKALQRETLYLQEANQRDVERIANVETCLSVLRHDITPFVSYLQNDQLPDELRSEVTGQLIRTFENIKNWTKLSIPSGLQFRKTVVCLQEIFDSVNSSVMNVGRVEKRLQTGKEEDMFHVKPTFIPTDICVVGDAQLIEIMLRNLVNNALQHTEDGSVTVKAEKWAEDSRFAHVTVADTGCGMTAEQIETLFRSDKKIKPTPAAGYGSGFGLMLCRYIIKMHDDNTIRGCRIWAESKEREGSVFHFLIAMQ